MVHGKLEFGMGFSNIGRPWLALILLLALQTAAGAELVRVQSGQLRCISEDGVQVFKGIPFAAAPVGELRWRVPQPPRAWQGVRDAGKL